MLTDDFVRHIACNIRSNSKCSLIFNLQYFNISCDLLENAKYQYATQAKYFKEIFEDDHSKNESEGTAKSVSRYQLT